MYWHEHFVNFGSRSPPLSPPSLSQACLTHVPTSLLSGEVCRVGVEIYNVGQVALNSLRITSSLEHQLLLEMVSDTCTFQIVSTEMHKWLILVRGLAREKKVSKTSCQFIKCQFCHNYRNNYVIFLKLRMPQKKKFAIRSNW